MQFRVLGVRFALLDVIFDEGRVVDVVVRECATIGLAALETLLIEPYFDIRTDPGVGVLVCLLGLFCLLCHNCGKLWPIVNPFLGGRL